METTHQNISKEDLINNWFYDLSSREDEELIQKLESIGCDLIPVYFQSIEEALTGKSPEGAFYLGRDTDFNFSVSDNYFYFNDSDQIQSCNYLNEMVDNSDLLNYLYSNINVECYKFDGDFSEDEQITDFEDFLKRTFLY